VLALTGLAFVYANRGAQTPAPSSMSQVLADIKARDKGQLAVSEEDGRFLRVLIATRGAKRALEIGGASGYSAIWIGSALKDTGGRLVTIEYDPGRAKELAENVRRAGVADVVQVVAGDAFEQIPRIEGTFDLTGGITLLRARVRGRRPPPSWERVSCAVSSRAIRRAPARRSARVWTCW
jgi:predicted O-methyltransferase YrrM